MPNVFKHRFQHRVDSERRVDSGDQDIIVIVIGPQGVAKSTFINTALGRQELSVSQVDSSTNEIQTVRHPYPGDEKGRHVIFVDTPPLDDDNKVEDIEKHVRQWMSSDAGRGQVAGILYLQRITDRKLTLPPFDHRGVYFGLQGKGLCQKCCFVTTFWNTVQEAMGAEREEELSTQWRQMLDSGSSLRRFDGTNRTAWSIVGELLKEVDQRPVVDRSGLIAGALRRVSDQNKVPHYQSRPAVGRHLDKAVVLIIGTTGHGKSKTINWLVGHDLLEVGGAHAASGSTPEVVRRVAIPLHEPQTGITNTLAFDEALESEDTANPDRDRNAVLMRRYSGIHFPEPQQDAVQVPDIDSSAKHELRRKTYPNAILLVTSWDSIKEDAHNDPEHFTSSIGKTMLTLRVSNLVDFERTNVIVVVTKSLSFWQDYEDEEDENEKKRHWCDDARKRTGIIGALQRKVFPLLRSWRVVFVENGGGHPVVKKHRTLPNGELSHQNLFEAICDLFTSADNGNMPKDLAGMHALPLLTGAERLGSLFEQRQVEALCELKSSETILEQERLSIAHEMTTVLHSATLADSEPLRDIANNVLGFTYNPAHGNLGSSCVLALDQTDVRIVKGATHHQFDQIVHTQDSKHDGKFTAAQFRADFQMRDVADFSSRYSSSASFSLAIPPNSHLYVARRLAAVARVVPLRPRLSAAMLSQINGLPQWAPETESDYQNFFECHGTHVVLCAALGGVLRIFLQGDVEINERTLRETLEAETGSRPHMDYDRKTPMSREPPISIFLDGGGTVASEVAATLQNLLRPSHTWTPHSDWPDVRARWMDALETESVFCPGDPQTQYWWLYNCDGLTAAQRDGLKLASRAYLGAADRAVHVDPTMKRSVHEHNFLPRNENLEEVTKILEQSHENYERAFADSKGQQGSEHPYTLDVMSDLAAVYQLQGRYRQAEQLYEQVLAVRENQLGAEHQSTLDAMSSLAAVRQMQGRYDEAVTLYRRMPAGSENGPEQQSTPDAMYDLATIHRLQGRYREAEKLYQRILAARRNELGPEDPSTLEALIHLAAVRRLQGRHGEAEELYGRALAARERVLGPEHLSTLESMGDLATVYLLQGRYDEARDLRGRMLAGRERILGPEHPITLESVHDFAAVCQLQGRHDEAEIFYRRVLEGREKILGSGHPRTLESVGDLTAVCLLQGRYDEAKYLRGRILAEKERILGPEHPSTLESVQDFAAACQLQGRYDEAEIFYRRALEGRERILGSGHPRTLESMGDLAAICLLQERYDEARDHRGRILAEKERILGPEHPSTLESVHDFAAVCQLQGRHDEAEIFYRRVLAGRERILGSGHPSTLESVRNLEAIHQLQDRYREPGELYPPARRM